MSFAYLIISSFILLVDSATIKTPLRQDELRRFPPSFKFGIATAAYQIEGAWNISDKSESIWDHMVHTQPDRIRERHNGDVAADSYHNYKRDIEMLKELNVDFYRFSIAWTRLMPYGFSNYISENGTKYYNDLIDELVKNNIEPVVTIYHWDLPQKLQDLGGWTNPFIEKWFGDYARVVFRLFGDRVKTWITINEAHQVCRNGYGMKLEPCAPALTMDGIAEYICAYNIQKAHANAYHIYDKEFRPHQQGKIGLSLEVGVYKPATNTTEDIEAAEDARLFHYDMYAHAIYTAEGDFPPRLKQIIAEKSKEQGYSSSRLPEFTPEEVEYIKGTADFFGVNFYDTYYATRVNRTSYVSKQPSFDDDRNVTTYKDPEWYRGGTSYSTFVPWGIREVVQEIDSRYNNPEIMISENGVIDANMEDNHRVKYFRKYLEEVLNTVLDDGIKVTAYTAWSLMDNFEWAQGYTYRFGLYHVDFNDPERKRTPRKSAFVYSHIAKTKTIDPSYEPFRKLQLYK